MKNNPRMYQFLKGWIRYGLICGAMTAPLWAATAAENLFQEAVMKETGNRDCEKAIALYKEVVQQAGDNHLLAARAQLRAGSCYEKLGKIPEAMEAYQQVSVHTADTPADIVLAAQASLQRLQAQEVRTSTPIVKIVRAEPPATRWALEFLELNGTETVDRKGTFLASNRGGFSGGASLTYFIKPGIGVGLHGGVIYSGTFYGHSSDPYVFRSISIKSNINYYALYVRAEKPIFKQLRPFVLGGPAIYVYHFNVDPGESTTKIAPGFRAQAGLTLGWTRGLTLSLGYQLHLLAQRTPDVDLSGVRSSDIGYYGNPTENHGLRALAGPTFSLGFRW